MKEFTHSDLVKIAYKWVLKNTSCGVAFMEFVANTPTGEIPDVIGFGSWRHSVVVEVKVSRSDFLSDKKKSFRAYPSLGMGTQRFYCCPTGLIKVEELPEKWGLVYVNENEKAVCVHNPYKISWSVPAAERELAFFTPNHEAERSILYSALRRFEKRGLMAIIYSVLGNNDIKVEVSE